MVDGHLNFDTKINTKGFDKGLGAIESSVDSLKGAVLKLGAAFGLAFSGKELIEAAAAMNAAESQFEQTFGALQDSAKSAIEAVADSSGILEKRLQGTATSIYAFAKTSGMESSQALDMMSKALQVAADSAAYYDRSLEETSETLKSFLKGNYANDAALGLSSTEATRNAKAMELYGKKFAELSEAQKQLTLLQMVKDANALSGAEGQAAREAEGWENVTGNLKQAWQELMSAVGQPVLALAVPVVKNLTAVLGQLTEIANRAARALSDVFGITLSNTDGSAALSDNAEQAADSYEQMAEATEEARTANEGSLASFDEINKLGDSEEESGTNVSAAAPSGILSSLENSELTVTVDADTSEADKKFREFFENIRSAFKTIFEPFKQAWDSRGAAVLDSLEHRFSSVKGLFSEIGASFAEVWSNGTGAETVGHILGIFTNINNTIGNIADRLKTAWTTDDLGTDIVQHAADIWNTILEHVESITGKISDWAAQVDFEPLLQSFDELEVALQPFADTMGEGLEWLFDNVLLPLADWTIEEAMPAALDVFTAAIEALTSAADALKKPGKWLWDKFLKPLGSWAGDIITDGLEDLADVLGDLGDWIDDNPDAAAWFTGLSAAVLGLNAAAKAGGLAALLTDLKAAVGTLAGLNVTVGVIVAGIAGWVYSINEISKHWSEISEVIEQDGGLFGFISGWIESCTEDIEEFLNAGWFGEKWTAFWEEVGGTIIMALSELPEWVKEKWEEIKEFFTGIPDWFKEQYEVIKDVFASVGDWFKEKFKTAVDGIKSVFFNIGKWFADRYKDITNAFKAAASWFKEKFDSAAAKIKNAFYNIGKWFSDRWADIKEVFSGAATWFSEKFSTAAENIKAAFTGIGTWFKDRWNDITGAFSNAATWFKDKFGSAASNIKLPFLLIGSWFTKRWKDIKDAFSNVKTWFKEKFEGAWDNVKSAFSGVSSFFGDIKETILGIWDGIKDGIKDKINWMIDLINDNLIYGINSISFDIPDWIPGIGGGTFGFDIPEIPRLAAGTVVPANYGEFLAILGDNKREAEVVSPLSTIRQAVMEALAALDGTGRPGGGQPMIVQVVLDGKVVGQTSVNYINDQTKANGRSPLKA